MAFLRAPHGIRGEIRAVAQCPEVIDFAGLVTGRDVQLRKGEVSLGRKRIVSVRPHQDTYLITFEGISDRDVIGELRGAEICLPRSELPQLPEGWYWEDEIAGSEVKAADGSTLGKAEGLDHDGALWSLTVKSPLGSIIRIPWHSGLVRSVDTDSHVITVDLPKDFPGVPSDGVGAAAEAGAGAETGAGAGAGTVASSQAAAKAGAGTSAEADAEAENGE